LVISPDGKWMVSSDDDDVSLRLWNLAASDTSPPQVTLSGHRGTITTVSFSADSKMLLTGSRDHTARVWFVGDTSGSDVAIAKSIELKGHIDDVSDACFTSDGAQAVTSSRDGTVKFWKVSLEAILKEARSRAGRQLTDEERSRFFLRH